jgi:hypothetical protein
LYFKYFFVGAISEIIAYWIGTTGLHPKTLIELEKKEILGSQSEGEPEEADEASSVDPNAYKIFGKRSIYFGVFEELHILFYF